jgi:hypothetical protein
MEKQWIHENIDKYWNPKKKSLIFCMCDAPM